MQHTPPPPLSRILRSTLHLVEYYAGPPETSALLAELKSALQRNISALDEREASASRVGKKDAPPTDA